MQIEKNIGDKMEKIDVMMDLIKNQDCNAQKWAKAFMQVYNSNPSLVIDEAFMIGWFANIWAVTYDKTRSSNDYNLGYNQGISDSKNSEGACNMYNESIQNTGNISKEELNSSYGEIFKTFIIPGIYIKECDENMITTIDNTYKPCCGAIECNHQ